MSYAYFDGKNRSRYAQTDETNETLDDITRKSSLVIPTITSGERQQDQRPLNQFRTDQIF
jgi:hypothetical protein